MIKKMSYKTFTFPHNPAKITVTAQSRIATAHCPEYGPVHQNLGPARRVISGSGCFYGATARADYVALETLLRQSSAGLLYIPGLGTVVAFLTDLKLEEEGDGSVLRYSFQFTELIAATDGEGTRYVD